MKLKLLSWISILAAIGSFFSMSTQSAKAATTCLETISSSNVTLITNGWTTEEFDLEMMDRLYQLEKLYIRGSGPQQYNKQRYQALPVMVMMVDNMADIWSVIPAAPDQTGGVMYLAEWNGCQLTPFQWRGYTQNTVRINMLYFTDSIRFDVYVFAVLGHEFAHTLGNWRHEASDGLGGPLAWDNPEFGVDILGGAWTDTCFQMLGEKSIVCEQVVDVVINGDPMPAKPLFGTLNLMNLH